MKTILTAQRLVLRPVEAADRDAVYAYSGDPEIRMMMFLPHASLAEAARFAEESAADWQRDDPADREFVLLLDGQIIGGVNLERCPESDTYEIGWIVHRDFRNRGYASEAAQALLRYAFDELDAVCVQAHCDSRNAASERVMQKLGMTLTDASGTREYPRTGETAGEYLYTITRAQYCMAATDA